MLKLLKGQYQRYLHKHIIIFQDFNFSSSNSCIISDQKSVQITRFLLLLSGNVG